MVDLVSDRPVGLRRVTVPSAQYRFPANYSNNLGARRRALHFRWQFGGQVLS